MSVREGLARLEGVEQVEERADLRTQTCVIRTRGGRLPDLPALARGVAELGIGARLRGVEAIVVGQLEAPQGPAALRLRDGTTLPLAALRGVVQSDFPTRRFRPAFRDERNALGRLLADRRAREGEVEVTGPLTRREDGGYELQVRRYRRLAPARTVR